LMHFDGTSSPAGLAASWYVRRGSRVPREGR
jgi:hypothetical protein